MTNTDNAPLSGGIAEQHPRDAIAAYLLDALPPDEIDAVEAHLSFCDECQEFAQELREVVDMLPMMAEERTPPPALKERLMAVVNEDAAQRAAPVPLRPLATQGRRRPRYGWATTLVAVAAVLTLVAMSAALLSQLGQKQIQTKVLADQIIPLMNYNQVKLGELDYYKTAERVEITLTNVKTLSTQQTYTAWLIRGHYNVERDIGALQQGGDGKWHLSVSGVKLRDYTLACVTVQNAGQKRLSLPLVAWHAIA